MTGDVLPEAHFPTPQLLLVSVSPSEKLCQMSMYMCVFRQVCTAQPQAAHVGWLLAKDAKLLCALIPLFGGHRA